MTAEQEVTFCISVINRYREELPQLRRKATLLSQQKEELVEEIMYWRKKYKEEKQEREKTQQENTKLKEEIEKLTKTNKRYQVALFDHGNFKNPASIEKKEKGGQAGHSNTNREVWENSDTYRRERLFVKACGTCGNMLPRVAATRSKILLDIIIKPEVVKLILESERQWCGGCKMEVYARDSRTLPFTEYGMNTFMLCLILRFKSHASMGNIATVISISHGLKLSKSDVSNLLQQAKKHLKSRYHKLIAAVQQGDVMYQDETGWLVNGQKAWLWIMANEETTVYFAAESRGKGIATELYGPSQARCMHDGLKSYENALPKEKHCYCWAHILRFAHEECITEQVGSEAVFLKDELVRIYHIKDNNPACNKKQLEAVLREELDRLLTITAKNQSFLNIQGRLRVQKEGLVNSLLYTKDGTNNLAERELRPMVINKRISNGSNTFKGMETSAIVGSIVQTISKKETDTIPALKDYLLEGIKEKYKRYLHTPSFDDS